MVLLEPLGGVAGHRLYWLMVVLAHGGTGTACRCKGHPLMALLAHGVVYHGAKVIDRLADLLRC